MNHFLPGSLSNLVGQACRYGIREEQIYEISRHPPSPPAFSRPCTCPRLATRLTPAFAGCSFLLIASHALFLARMLLLCVLAASRLLSLSLSVALRARCFSLAVALAERRFAPAAASLRSGTPLRGYPSHSRRSRAPPAHGAAGGYAGRRLAAIRRSRREMHICHYPSFFQLINSDPFHPYRSGRLFLWKGPRKNVPFRCLCSAPFRLRRCRGSFLWKGPRKDLPFRRLRSAPFRLRRRRRLFLWKGSFGEGRIHRGRATPGG